MPRMHADEDEGELKHTPLEDEHRRLGAKLAPFAGWLMPIEYEGALEEHRAVRERVGLFDLTHLGKVEVTGPGALGMLQWVVTNDLSKAAVGEALYNLVLNEGGGRDRGPHRVSPGAGALLRRAERVERPAGAPDASRRRRPTSRVHLMYHQDWCFLAVQGPESVHVMQQLFPEAGDLSFMQCVESEYHRRPVIVTRSGYTGEVGFELFTYQDVARELWSDAHRGHGRRSAACRAASPRATCSAWRWATRSTARTCSSPSPRSRPASDGPWRSTRVSSAGESRCCDSGTRGCPAGCVGLRMQERRHIPRAALPGVPRRPADR